MARKCQRVAVRVSESQSGSHRAIESQRETGRDPFGRLVTKKRLASHF